MPGKRINVGWRRFGASFDVLHFSEKIVSREWRRAEIKALGWEIWRSLMCFWTFFCLIVIRRFELPPYGIIVLLLFVFSIHGSNVLRRFGPLSCTVSKNVGDYCVWQDDFVGCLSLSTIKCEQVRNLIKAYMLSFQPVIMILLSCT